MTEFNNPIEKYNKQDRKLFSFLKGVDNFLSYLLYAFLGIVFGVTVCFFIKYAWWIGALSGTILGLLVAKIEISIEEKFNENLVGFIIPAVLFLALISSLVLTLIF